MRRSTPLSYLCVKYNPVARCCLAQLSMWTEKIPKQLALFCVSNHLCCSPHSVKYSTTKPLTLDPYFTQLYTLAIIFVSVHDLKALMDRSFHSSSRLLCRRVVFCLFKVIWGCFVSFCSSVTLNKGSDQVQRAPGSCTCSEPLCNPFMFKKMSYECTESSRFLGVSG